MARNLTVAKIKKVDADIAAAAKKSRVRCALIGGALFKLLGLDGYETPDMDYASTGDLRPGILDEVDDPTVFSWNRNGHFLVRGVKVDFINKLTDGTKRLFLAAVRERVVLHGVWCAPLAYALAIRLAAGREKDVAMLKSVILERKYARAVKVAKFLVYKYAPNSVGGKLLKKYGHIRPIPCGRGE